MIWQSDRTRPAPDHRSHGYSLLEMLVVLTILAMIAALTPAAYRTIRPGIELRSTAGEISALLRTARSDAVRTGRDAVVVFDLDRKSASMESEDSAITWPDDVEVTAIVAESERPEANRGGIRFFPGGGSTGGKLHLRTRKYAYDVTVDWLLGTVQVEKSNE